MSGGRTPRPKINPPTADFQSTPHLLPQSVCLCVLGVLCGERVRGVLCVCCTCVGVRVRAYVWERVQGVWDSAVF